jgi:hypothetical protein
MDGVLVARSSQLSSQQPHGPARYDGSAQKQGEAVEAVADHFARGIAVGDAEDDGGEDRKDDGRAEVSEMDGHNVPNPRDDFPDGRLMAGG